MFYKAVGIKKGTSMQVNSVSNLSFKAQVSQNFKTAAKNYYSKVAKDRYQRRDMLDNLEAKVDEFKLFGDNDMVVTYKTTKEDGKKMHALYIEQEGYEPILLSKKDQFRKLASKFMHVSDYEFAKKIEQNR